MMIVKLIFSIQLQIWLEEYTWKLLYLSRTVLENNYLYDLTICPVVIENGSGVAVF